MASLHSTNQYNYDISMTNSDFRRTPKSLNLQDLEGQYIEEREEERKGESAAYQAYKQSRSLDNNNSIE